ncbi:MAG: hypothetical protein H7Z14_16215 [Anaerolineae bacterium]|nr:hypothetical protein [Phycisphaerae bacterium]
MNSRASTFRRRGSVYVMVLGISLLVSVIGIAALTAVRVQLRTSSNANDSEDARLFAQSGVEVARNWINSDPAWRTSRASGATATLTLGKGSVSISMIDPGDGDFTDSPFDSLKLTATGYKGLARQKIQVTLTPVPFAYSCLTAGIVSGGNLTLGGGADFVANGTVASNAGITIASGCTMDANAEAVGTCSGLQYLGSKINGAAPREMPDATVFDYYIANGTAISYAATGGSIDKVLLSPGNNPYGPTNSNGIYVINCAGQNITIKMSRIVGTLVILNCGSGSKTDNNISLEPFLVNHPVLMVKGSMTFEHDAGVLTDSSNRNFNPPGSPYNGVTNATSSDTYPSTIKGLTYISGNVTFKKDGTASGPLVVGGTIASDHDLNLTSSNVYQTNPPPGFFDPPPMKVSTQSWAQAVD